jgi:hypothetical protein
MGATLKQEMHGGGPRRRVGGGAKGISNGATHPAPARPDGLNRTKTRPSARTHP